MPTIKLLCGLACFIVALFPAGLACGAVTYSDWSHLPRWKILAIASALMPCALASVAAGIFLIRRRRVALSMQTGALLTASILAIFSLSIASSHYLRAYSMTAAERVREELRKIDAAIEQPSTERPMP